MHKILYVWILTKIKFKHAIIIIEILSLFFWILLSDFISYVNDIPELHGQNYGKWHQKLEIALALAEIDLAVTVPAPKEPEKPVRAQNEADDAWTIREKNHDRAMMQYDIDKTRWNTSNRKCLMIIKGSISDNIEEAIPESTTSFWVSRKGEEAVHWLFQGICC